MATRKAQNDEKTVARTRKTRGSRHVAHADAKSKAVVQTRAQRVRRSRTSQSVSSSSNTGNAKRRPGRPRKVAVSPAVEAAPAKRAGSRPRKIEVVQIEDQAVARPSIAPWEKEGLARVINWSTAFRVLAFVAAVAYVLQVVL